jgi:hypothetical protein
MPTTTTRRARAKRIHAPGRVPERQPRGPGRSPGLLQVKKGRYADGTPFRTPQYLACKVILKADRFTSPKVFQDFGEVVAAAADEFGIGVATKPFAGAKPAIREVLFLDTPDFRLYKKSFILRRRIRFEDGFPVGEPEIVFKFRNPDLQAAAEADVRPNFAGDCRVKFKCQALTLRDQVGAFRLLFSHNVQFPLSQVPEGDRTSTAFLSRLFPLLHSVLASGAKRLELVNQTFIEEVLQDICMLDFGKGMTARANVGMWRTRGEHKPLVGEFAFQYKFKSPADLEQAAIKRCQEFFIKLQTVGRDWLQFGLTKTGALYRLKGDEPKSAE